MVTYEPTIKKSSALEKMIENTKLVDFVKKTTEGKDYNSCERNNSSSKK